MVGMRFCLSALFLYLAVASCKEQKSPPAVTIPNSIVEEEEDMFARRDAMLTTRQKIREERKQITERLRVARAEGSDTTELDKAAEALLQKEKRLMEEEVQLNRSLEALLKQRRTMMQALASSNDAPAQLAGREAALAGREREVAGREKDFAKREAALAKRESELAKRERETCGVSAPATIIQTVDVKGSKYTKQDVEPLLQRARKKMSKKGILRSDLPAPAQELEQEATKAMRKGDYGRARFAASQLVATIGSIRINKGFIATKINRLNKTIRGKQLTPDAQKVVDRLFRSATANYGDGRFSKANRHLNKIYAAIR